MIDSNLNFDPIILKKVEELSQTMPEYSLYPIDGKVDDKVGLILSYLTYISNGDILEIGCGKSSNFIYSCLKKNKFYIIDINSDKINSVRKQFMQSLLGKISQVKFIVDDSRWVDLRNIKIDLLWIDGNHSLSAFINDFTKFLPLLNLNGYILAHDFTHLGGPKKDTIDLFGDFIVNNSEKFGISIISRITSLNSETEIAVFGKGLFMAQKVSEKFTKEP